MNKAFSELGSLLTPAQTILITIPKNPNFDQAAACLALFLSLQKTGKQVSVLSSEEMTVGFSHLVGVDKIGSKLDGQDLVVSLPMEKVEKVTSSDEGGRLNLVIRAKPGSLPIKKEEIVFSSTRPTVDLILAIGVDKLENLGKIYQENKNLFEENPLVNIGPNFLNPQASSCSEVVADLIQNLGLPVDEDIGGNLLLGLREATDNFQNPTTTAATFEAAAFCLKTGVKSEPLVSPSPDWLEPKIYKGSTLP